MCSCETVGVSTKQPITATWERVNMRHVTDMIHELTVIRIKNTKTKKIKNILHKIYEAFEFYFLLNSLDLSRIE